MISIVHRVQVAVTIKTTKVASFTQVHTSSSLNPPPYVRTLVSTVNNTTQTTDHRRAPANVQASTVLRTLR